jgi:group I intron endonuclease
MEHLLYKLTAPNGKVYIGRTKEWKNRLKDHKHCAYTKKLQQHLYKSIRKYGWENFTKEILCTAPTEEAAIILEESLILKFDSVENGLNESYSGAGGGGVFENPKVKERHRTTLSKMFSGKNNPMYGRNQSEEAKAKQREMAKGRFSLQWFIDRHGEVEGTRLYNERSSKLSSRKLSRDSFGRYTK